MIEVVDVEVDTPLDGLAAVVAWMDPGAELVVEDQLVLADPTGHGQGMTRPHLDPNPTAVELAGADR